MRITHAFLVHHHACADQCALFVQRYPQGLTVSAETLTEAAQAGLSIGWLAQFIPATRLAAYQAGRAPLLATYRAGRAPLLATYEAGRASLWAAYEAGRAPLLAEALQMVQEGRV